MKIIKKSFLMICLLLILFASISYFFYKKNSDNVLVSLKNSKIINKMNENFMNQYNEYEYKINEEIINFSGKRKLNQKKNNSTINMFEHEDIDLEFSQQTEIGKIIINNEENEFKLTQINDDYFIILNEDDYSISDILYMFANEEEEQMKQKLNFAISLSLVVGSLILIAAYIVLVAIVEVLITVAQKIWSFFSWLISWVIRVEKKPVYETIPTQLAISITINSLTKIFTLLRVTEQNYMQWQQNVDNYYLAIPLGQNVYISTIPFDSSPELSFYIGAVILSQPEKHTKTIKNLEYKGILSTYTQRLENAEIIAAEAWSLANGIGLGKSFMHEINYRYCGSTKFKRFHPGINNDYHLGSHSFFGLPDWR